MRHPVAWTNECDIPGHDIRTAFGGLENSDGCQPVSEYVPGCPDDLGSWKGYRFLPGSHSMGSSSSHFSLRSLLILSFQAWIEASTKGAVLLFTASEIESATSGLGLSPAVAGLIGGMGGGIAQAYATMGKLRCWLHMPLDSTLIRITCVRFLYMYEDCRNHAA